MIYWKFQSYLSRNIVNQGNICHKQLTELSKNQITHPSLQDSWPCMCSDSCRYHSCGTSTLKSNVISKPSNELPHILTINLDGGAYIWYTTADQIKLLICEKNEPRRQTILIKINYEKLCKLYVTYLSQ